MGKISVAEKMRMQRWREHLTACVAASGGRFRAPAAVCQLHCPSPSLHPHFSTKKSLFSEPPTYYKEQDAQLSQRNRAAGCVIGVLYCMFLF